MPQKIERIIESSLKLIEQQMAPGLCRTMLMEIAPAQMRVLDANVPSVLNGDNIEDAVGAVVRSHAILFNYAMTYLIGALLDTDLQEYMMHLSTQDFASEVMRLYHHERKETETSKERH